MHQLKYNEKRALTPIRGEEKRIIWGRWGQLSISNTRWSTAKRGRNFVVRGKKECFSIIRRQRIFSMRKKKGTEVLIYRAGVGRPLLIL